MGNTSSEEDVRYESLSPSEVVITKFGGHKDKSMYLEAPEETLAQLRRYSEHAGNFQLILSDNPYLLFSWPEPGYEKDIIIEGGSIMYKASIHAPCPKPMLLLVFQLKTVRMYAWLGNYWHLLANKFSVRWEPGRLLLMLIVGW